MSNSELKKLAEKRTAQIVKSELDKKAYEDVAWLKALKKADGDEIKARALYIDLRSVDLVEEVLLKLRTMFMLWAVKDYFIEKRKKAIRIVK